MNNIIKLILILSIFFLGTFVGQNYDFPPGVSNSKPSLIPFNNEEQEKLNLSLFWKVWDSVSQKYIDKSKVDPKKMVDGAIAGMVSSIEDPYSVYLSPSQNKNFKDNLSGKYSGVGIQMGFRQDRMVVIAPIDDTPASRADVKPNDHIVKIDDKETMSMTLPQAVSLIRGQAGTTVKLTLIREGQEKTHEVNLTREEITVKTVTLKEVSGKTAYLKITQFGDDSDKEWDKIVSEVLSNGYKKIILDLRNNPGGRFDKAIFIASEFVEKGIVARQVWYDGRKQDYPTLGQGRLLNIPVVVLVNKGSASASEILAGALKDNQRAKIVGENTFGKGTVQEVEEYENGAGLHITSSKWLTPSGAWMDEIKGLKPDFEVKVEEDKDNKTPLPLESDPFIKKALEIS